MEEEPCWLAVLEAELGCCVDNGWFGVGGGQGCVRREASNGCEERYGATEKQKEAISGHPRSDGADAGHGAETATLRQSKRGGAYPFAKTS